MKISEIIYEIMQVNNLSQQKLANILEISQKAISNWLNDMDYPKASSIMQIYYKFSITPNELLGLEEPTNFNLKCDYNKIEEPHYTPPPQQGEYLTALARADKRTEFKVSKKEFKEMQKQVKPENE